MSNNIPQPNGPKSPKNNQPMDSRSPFQWWWLLVAGVLMFYLFTGNRNNVISAIELEKLIQNNEVAELVFQPENQMIYAKVVAKDKKENPRSLEARAVTEDHFDHFRKLAEQRGIKYSVKNPPNPWLGTMIMVGIMVVFLIFIFRSVSNAKGGAGAAGLFTKSPGQLFKRDSVSTNFGDVAGCDEAKDELQEVVAFLKEPDKFVHLGAKIPRGVLMYGAPGTGKTLLARAVAGEADVPFLFASGAGFIEMFVGVGAARIRSLFAEAKKFAPCILFIDEIDAIGKKRGLAIGGGHDEREQALNELLREMDGFVGHTNIVIIAATNRLDVLDDALTRPGRFDRQIYVSKPDFGGREAILKVHSRDKKLGADVNLKDVAKDTVGMSGAELENVMNEAALLATRRDKKAIEQVDLTDAVDKVTMGPEKKSTKLTENEKKTVAYHEAGHALVAALEEHADPVHKITIIPRGLALGYVKQLPIEDRHLVSKNQLLAMVAVCLGGRIAEELVLSDISSGAANDLQKANQICRKMVCELGMNDKVGLAVYRGSVDFWGQDTGIDASESAKELLEKEIRATLDRAYERVKRVLRENRKKLDALAEELMGKETLTAEEVKKVIS